MSADNSHAERQTYKRRSAVHWALRLYDEARRFAPDDEYVARQLGALSLTHRLHCDQPEAFNILADALALRAAAKQE